MSYSTSIIEFETFYFVIISIIAAVSCYALYLLISLSRLAIKALKIYISKNKM